MSENEILDKDKLWVVFYIGIGGIDDADVPIYIREISDYFKYDKSVNVVIIPIREFNSRIEFYNADKLTPEIIENFNLKRILEEMNQNNTDI